MNVLMGKVQRTGGALRINDEVDEIHNYRNLIGFVPQVRRVDDSDAGGRLPIDVRPRTTRCCAC